MTWDFNHTIPTRQWNSRLYETEQDLREMQAMLMAARSQTDAWRYTHVGELMRGFFMVTCRLNRREHIRLWHNQAGTLVGYAILGEDPSFDCQVLPAYEWSGIEAEAMAWAETHIREPRQQDAKRRGSHFDKQENQTR